MAIAAVLAPMTAPCWAQDMTYSPVNPSFGGSALNGSHLLSIAGAQRNATARDYVEDIPVDDATSQADQFVAQLQSRLFASLAGQVADSIFGDNPQDSGTIVFGTTTIDFVRDTGQIELLVSDDLTGGVTVISIPQLVIQ